MARRNEKPHRIRKLFKRVFLVLVLLLLAVVAESYLKLYFVNSPALPKPPKLITASPVDLNQIIGFSKFRSCNGQDYSGKNDQGIIENKRTMKMSVFPANELRNKLHVIKIYAPFDGKITFIFQENGTDKQPSYQIYVQSSKQPDYAITFFHSDPLPGTQIGSKINAGQLLAYAHVRGDTDFDIALHHLDHTMLMQDVGELFNMPILPLPKNGYLMPFTNYLSSKVAADFNAVGFDLNNMVISKQYRDNHPCNFNAPTVDNDYQFLPGKARSGQTNLRVQ